jgi:glycosyltransferase involved in cell wall biosynthesis
MRNQSSRKQIDYLFLTNSLSGGGAERAINIAVNEIAKRNSSVGLLVVNDGPQDLYAPKVPTFEVKRRWQGGAFSLLTAYVKTYYLVIRIRPKVLILNCDLPEFLGAFLFGPWQLVAVEHAPNPWHTRVGLGLIVRKILSVRKTLWVTVSDHLEIWKINAKSEHIPNAISEFSESVLDQHHVNDSVTRLVFIGRLAKVQKQPQWMLEIANLTKLPLVFIGDGVYRAELEKESKNNQTPIDFLGYSTNPWNEIRPGDILVIPSAWEGDGLVVIEAISHGIPILLNKVDDLTRFQLPSVHYCSSTEEFAERIEEYKNNLSKLVVETFIAESLIASRNPELVARQWINFLAKVK